MDDHHATTMEDINIYQLHPKIRGFTATMGWYQFLSQKNDQGLSFHGSKPRQLHGCLAIVDEGHGDRVLQSKTQ
jgi:hypothetical protein